MSAPEVKNLDICATQGQEYAGPRQAIAAWNDNKRFLHIGGQSVRRSELDEWRKKGYTHVRVFIGHRFHVVEKL